MRAQGAALPLLGEQFIFINIKRSGDKIPGVTGNSPINTVFLVTIDGLGK